MKIKAEGKVRLTAAVLSGISFALGFWLSPAWLWLSVLVGVGLIQSAFTGFCPMENFFRALEKKNA